MNTLSRLQLLLNDGTPIENVIKEFNHAFGYLVGYEDEELPYVNNQRKYDNEYIKVILASEKRLIPYTKNQLAMMAYLKQYIKLSEIISWCATVYPKGQNAVATRKAIERIKKPLPCSAIEFIYDYESIFGDRGLDVSEIEQRKKIVNALTSAQSRIKRLKDDILRQYKLNMKLVGKPCYADLCQEFNVSRSSLMRLIERHENSLY